MEIKKGCARGGVGSRNERTWYIEFETRKDRDNVFKLLTGLKKLLEAKRTKRRTTKRKPKPEPKSRAKRYPWAEWGEK